MSDKKGFTLIEITLVVGLVAVLAGGFFFAYRSYQLYSDLDVAAITVAQGFRRAQMYSQAVKEDDDWGVKISEDKVVIFKGDSYAGRDEIYDEITEFPSNVAVSSLTELIFSKFSGTPQAIGTATLTSLDGTIREIEIQSAGQISY